MTRIRIRGSDGQPPLAVSWCSACCVAGGCRRRRRRRPPPQAAGPGKGPRRWPANWSAAVLDIQLRQLEENGLKGLPIYKDIAAMKGEHRRADEGRHGSDRAAPRQGPGRDASRAAGHASTRPAARFAKSSCSSWPSGRSSIAACRSPSSRPRCAQLIALETKAYNTTKALPERKLEERERLALATIEDQADVQKLFYQLVATLEDVSTWGGQIGAGASDGLRILKAAQVDPELKKAGETLGQGGISRRRRRASMR